MRNSLLVMLNREFFEWTRKLADDPNFKECTALSDRALEEQYDMELVMRFLALRTMPPASLSGISDIGEFLTEKAKELACDNNFNMKNEETAFRTTFELLAKTLSNDSFRRYDKVKDRFLGGFSISAVEVVALGVGYDYNKLIGLGHILVERVKSVWSDTEFNENSGAGVRAGTRIPKIIPLGRALFEKW